MELFMCLCIKEVSVINIVYDVFYDYVLFIYFKQLLLFNYI